MTRASKRVRGSGMLIRSRPTKIEASVLMALSVILDGRSIFHARDMAALRKAHDLYPAARAEITRQAHSRAAPAFDAHDLSDAWSIIRKGRGARIDQDYACKNNWCLACEWLTSRDEATRGPCRRCGCVYYLSLKERTTLDCLFCRRCSGDTGAIAPEDKRKSHEYGNHHREMEEKSHE